MYIYFEISIYILLFVWHGQNRHVIPRENHHVICVLFGMMQIIYIYFEISVHIYIMKWINPIYEISKLHKYEF